MSVVRQMAALLMLALLLPPAAQVGAEPINAEGQAWVAEPDKVVFGVQTRSNFRATLTELVPEWSYVEQADVVGRLYTPLLEEEVKVKKVLLREAKAAFKRTKADAEATLAELESELLSARVDQQQARAELALWRKMPSPDELKKLQIERDGTVLRSGHARAHLALLKQLEGIGLCSEVELSEAERAVERLAERRRAQEAALAELRAKPESLGAAKAELEARAADLLVRIARLRRDREAGRQELLCEAAELEKVGPRRRELELTRRRVEAMTLRAPSAGYVEYGKIWRENRAEEKLKKGKPVWFGQTVASIIDLDELHVLARVEESRFFEICRGDRAEVSFRAIPGKVYHGAIQRILPIVRAQNESFLEIKMDAPERRGMVVVDLRDLDERVKPGMMADVSLLPGTAGGDATAPAQAARKRKRPTGRERAESPPPLALKGWLKASRTRFIRAPFAGRVTWAAEQGSLLEQGDPVMKLDPGLQEDWRSEIESELRLRKCRLKAARQKLALQQHLEPLLKEAARAKVKLAKVALRQLEAQPTKSERLSAQCDVAQAEWELREARERLSAYGQLAEQGLATRSEVKRRQLKHSSAEAALEMTRANLQKVLRGAPEPELALARADLELARVSARKVESEAKAAVNAAAQSVEAAEAELEVYTEKAQRRRRKARKARVTSPIDGILLYAASEGQEVREGWWIGLLADTTRSEVHAALDEVDYFRVRNGAPARVRLAGLPGCVYRGEVTELTDWQTPWWHGPGAAGQKVKTGKVFDVTVRLEGSPPRCVGMSATVALQPAEKRSAADQKRPPRTEEQQWRR